MYATAIFHVEELLIIENGSEDECEDEDEARIAPGNLKCRH